MVSIVVEKKIVGIFQAYLDDRLTDPLEVLKHFQEDEFTYSIKFEKYKSSINAPAAKVIIDFQEAIYRIAALSLKGSPDIRLLTKEEKQQLEVPFKILESSTIQDAKELLRILKELLAMIPEKHRATCLIAMLVIVFGYLGWGKYIEHQDKVLENQDKAAILHTFESVVAKLDEQNSRLADIVANYEKTSLLQMSQIDESLQVQGTQVNSKELRQVKRSKYPQTQKEISNLRGSFIIVDINLKDNYLLVEENENQPPIKIHYDANNLLTEMQNLKDQLHKAIDHQSKRFYIEASIVIKDGRVDTRVLSSIKEDVSQ